MIIGPIWSMLLSVIQVVFFGRAHYTKETLFEFLLNYGSR